MLSSLSFDFQCKLSFIFHENFLYLYFIAFHCDLFNTQRKKNGSLRGKQMNKNKENQVFQFMGQVKSLKC